MRLTLKSLSHSQLKTEVNNNNFANDDGGSMMKVNIDCLLEKNISGETNKLTLLEMNTYKDLYAENTYSFDQKHPWYRERGYLNNDFDNLGTTTSQEISLGIDSKDTYV